MQSVRNPLLVSLPRYPAIVRYTTSNCTPGELRALSVYMGFESRAREGRQAINPCGAFRDGRSAVIEHASHDALAAQLLDDHPVNEGFEIGAGQIGADCGKAASQVFA